MKNFRFGIMVLGSLIILALSAQAGNNNIVVQSYKDVMKSGMYEPGFKQGGQNNQEDSTQSGNSVIAVGNPNEKPKDYNKDIAKSLFTDETLDPLSIELDQKQNNVKFHIGQPLEVLLPQDGEALWFYDNSFKKIAIAKDYQFQGKRILNIEAQNKGKEKIFFDLIEDTNGEIKVIESRVLNIMVE